MTGKFQKLDKPFAVLTTDQKNGKTFHVKALVKEKIIFKTRPKEMVELEKVMLPQYKIFSAVRPI